MCIRDSKKSSGETKGRQGSSSRNYDVLGRELFTPDEVRKLDNKKCIIFIRGFDPIMDNKFIPFNHPMFNQTADGKGEPYVCLLYTSMAAALVESFISHLSSRDDLEKAAVTVAEGIKDYSTGKRGR